MKNIRVFVSENFQFLEVKFSIYLNRRVVVMISLAIQNSSSEDSDLTARMHRLIGIFAEPTCPKVRFLTLWLICESGIS